MAQYEVGDVMILCGRSIIAEFVSKSEMISPDHTFFSCCTWKGLVVHQHGQKPIAELSKELAFHAADKHHVDMLGGNYSYYFKMLPAGWFRSKVKMLNVKGSFQQKGRCVHGSDLVCYEVHLGRWELWLRQVCATGSAHCHREGCCTK